MLALTRALDESIVIRVGNEDVIITVVDIRADKIRLGVEAPPHILVDRYEIAIDKGWRPAAPSRATHTPAPRR